MPTRLLFNVILTTTALILLTLPLAHADENEKRRPRAPVTSVYATLRKEGVVTMCKEASPYSSCIYPNVAACQAGVSQTLEACISGDQKHHADFMLTEEQQKTVASAMLTCVQQAVVGARKDDLNIKCLSEAKTLSAQSPYETRYMLMVASDVQKLRIKSEELKSNNRAACPGYRGQDLGGCFKQLVKDRKITSSDGAIVLLSMGAQAAAKDKASATDPRSAALAMMDAELAVMEQIDPAKFAINELVAGTLSEQMARRMLVRTENEKLVALKDQAIRTFKQSLDARPSRRPASNLAWQVGKETELRLRLAALKARTFSIK